MKKLALMALTSLMIVGVSTTALGDGSLDVLVDKTRTHVELPASSVESVQDLVDKMGGFTSYDKKSGKLIVETPRVNMLVLEGIQQVRNKGLVFTNPIKGWTDKDIPRSFGVFVEVDDAPVSKELECQVVLIAPNGKELDSGKQQKFSTINGNSFFFSEPFISTKLPYYGTYKVQLKMRRSDKDPYTIVGENSFTVGR
ncbi:hypothetical protein ACQCN2_08255 [Brevibacillus ginsengisoli]|uniref:hypothetical protein n=1 Tax=Brevibacillus ginsengisoli TaxID=363854 RepID=UPI003CF198DC